MGFFKKTKGTIYSEYFMLREDIAHLEANNAYDVRLYEDYLLIHNLLGEIKLKYDQITDIFYGPKTEIIKKERSAIGRAVVGGLLFGGVGAMVGATSAVGREKSRKKTRLYFIISFISSDNKESFLVFEDTRHYHGKKLAKKLMEIANIDDTNTIQEYL